MNRHRVEMAITGETVSPESVSVSLLSEILTRIERAIGAYAQAKMAEVATEDLTISLVDIRAGSECLTFSVPEPLVPAVAGISKALELGEHDDLPRSTYTELYEISDMVSRRGWNFEIREQPRQNVRPAVFGFENALPPPSEPVRVRGTTTLHGRCLRVGGATQPKAEIRPATGSKILNVELSEEIAKQLATRLYEEVVLQGEATWNSETWEVESFRVSSVTNYRRTEPTLAFRELAEAAGSEWDEVDAAAYVRALRADDG